MSVARRLAAILAADIVGYSRLAAADEEGTVARLHALRHEVIDPVIAANRGRTVKTTGDGRVVEFASVVDAVRCAVEVQRKTAVRNADVAPDRRIEFRVGIHLGDIMVESDGDLMGDGVNIAARLEGIAEPGGVCLSEQAYWQVRDKIAAEFTDWGERELKNLARPVRVYAIAPPGDAAPAQAGVHASDARTSTTVDPGFRRGGAKGEVIEKQAPPRLSIVVLPFANIGGDPEQEYFVDGVTESLTTDLSRISGSFVIARNTAFTYKGKPVDVKAIGRELNVRYVLEGSVQKGGQRLRVNVQLIEAETGAHLWAERFDKPLADLFDMQDEIVARLANQLQARLIEVEARRAERDPDPDSMDLYFQGMAWANKGQGTLEVLTRARALFERALQRDPDNVDALAALAMVDFGIGGQNFTDKPHELMAMAEAEAQRALLLAPNHALAHRVLGTIYMFTNRGDQAIVECEHALMLDRNLAHARASIGFAKMIIGRAAETEAYILDALRISPRDVMVYNWLCIAGVAKAALGRDEEAVAWLRRSIDANRNFPIAQFYLAGALARLGRLEEARAAVQAGSAQHPNFTIAGFRSIMVASSNDPIALAQSTRLLEGLRLAGVPEE